MFHQISKQREESRLKNEAEGVWISDKALFRVFHIHSQRRFEFKVAEILCLLRWHIQTSFTVVIYSHSFKRHPMAKAN